MKRLGLISATSVVALGVAYLITAVVRTLAWAIGG